MENPLQDFKELINDLENIAGEIAQKHDIENLKGPQGKALYYLFKHQERDIFVKDIEQWLHIFPMYPLLNTSSLAIITRLWNELLSKRYSYFLCMNLKCYMVLHETKGMTVLSCSTHNKETKSRALFIKKLALKFILRGKRSHTRGASSFKIQ